MDTKGKLGIRGKQDTKSKVDTKAKLERTGSQEIKDPQAKPVTTDKGQRIRVSQVLKPNFIRVILVNSN